MMNITDLQFKYDGGIDSVFGQDTQYEIEGITIITPNVEKGRKCSITIHATRELVTANGQTIKHPNEPQAGYKLEQDKISINVDGETLFEIDRDEQGQPIFIDGVLQYKADEQGDLIPRNNASLNLLFALKTYMGSELDFGFKEFHKLV